MRRSRVLALSALAACAGALALNIESAGACSCAYADPRDKLEQADAALIGKVIRVEKVPTGRNTPRSARYEIRIERSFKQQLPETIELGTSETSCGVPLRVGERLAAYLDGPPEKWELHTCTMESPRALIRAAQPYPSPTGAGRVALLAAGDFSNARLMAFDTRGRLLAYGFGDGEAHDISLCPGGTHVVELVSARRGGGGIAVRRLPDMRVVRSLRAPRNAQSVQCAARAGATVYAFAATLGEPYSRSRLHRLGGGAARVLHRGTGSYVAFGARFAYLTEGRLGRDLVRVDLRNGRETRIARIPRWPGPLALSPDGRALATTGFVPPTSARPVIVDLRSRPARVHVGRRRPGDFEGGMVWAGPRRALLFGGGIRVFDIGLRERRRALRFAAQWPAVLSGRLYSADYGSLRVLNLGNGRSRRLALMPKQTISDFLAVPAQPRVQVPQARPACFRRR